MMRNIWLILAMAGGLGSTQFHALGAVAEPALSEATSSLFSGSAHCAFCHDAWSGALVDHQSREVSIVGDWRATMMSHAFKDPLWQARMEAEVIENPQLQSFIENKCQTCHAPMARTQAHYDGRPELPYQTARTMPLAQDGVSCTLCHQIQSDNLGRKSSYTGHYVIQAKREIFGPYKHPISMPMQRHVDYLPKHGKHTQDSSLCATCHTLFTPIFNAQGKVAGEFPEQTPYLEWQNSDYAAKGIHCQDCHLPKLDEPIKISARPPWVQPRQPFWRHQFAGGNAFMLKLLSQSGDAELTQASIEQFDRMLEKTRHQLEASATLNLAGKRQGNDLAIKVEIRNQAGHKLPTGYPYRRMWLHLKVTGPDGQIVFESGKPDADGRLTHHSGGFEPHHEVIARPQQVQIYEAVMGDAKGQVTHSLLKAAVYLKDNRLPPKGFSAKKGKKSNIGICGEASKDADFNAKGNGLDVVSYEIELPPGLSHGCAEVELLYQPVPPEAVQHLRESKAPAATRFAALYQVADKSPSRIQRQRLDF